MLRENDGRGAMWVGEAAGLQRGGRAADFRKFRTADTACKADTAPAPENGSMLARRVFPMLVAAVFLAPTLALLAHGAEVRTASVTSIKSYSSRSAYLRAQNHTYSIEEGEQLRFYDPSGKQIRTVRVGRDSDGYLRRSMVFDQAAVIVRSTSGYEWGADFFEFYGPSGEKTGELLRPFTNWAISPAGNLLVVAEPDSATEYHSSGRFIAFSSSGVKLFEHQSRRPPEMPGVSFSPDGRFVAFPMFGIERRLNEGRISVDIIGSIAVMSAEGALVGYYETPGWMPGREYGATSTSGPMKAMAEVDSTNRVVVAGGFEGRSRRTVIAIDFAGSLLWKWQMELDRARCESMVKVDSIARIVLAVDLCANESRLRTIDLLSGKQLRESVLAHRPGAPLQASIAVSPKGNYFLLNTQRRGVGAAMIYSSVLLDSTLATPWRDEQPDELAAGFDSLGQIVVHRQKALDVKAIR